MNENHTDSKELNQKIEKAVKYKRASGNELIDSLAQTVPQAEAAFQQNLEDNLLAQLQPKQIEDEVLIMAKRKRMDNSRLPLTLAAAVLAIILVGGLLLAMPRGEVENALSGDVAQEATLSPYLATSTALVSEATRRAGGDIPPAEGCGTQEANIMAPRHGARVHNRFFISGSARSENFAQARIEIAGTSTNGEFIVLDTLSEPQQGGGLAVFNPNTTILEDGLYQIRLTTFDTNNVQVASCTIYIAYSNALPSAPAADDFSYIVIAEDTIPAGTTIQLDMLITRPPHPDLLFNDARYLDGRVTAVDIPANTIISESMLTAPNESFNLDSDSTVPVVIAVIDIALGNIITEEMVTVAYLPEDSINSAHFSEIDTVIGMQSQTHIRPFEPIIDSAVTEAITSCSNMICTETSGGAVGFPIDYSFVSFHTDDIAGQLIPGDKVDVLASVFFTNLVEDGTYHANIGDIEGSDFTSFTSPTLVQLRVMEDMTLVRVDEEDGQYTVILAVPSLDSLPLGESTFGNSDLALSFVVVPHVEDSEGLSEPRIISIPPNTGLSDVSFPLVVPIQDIALGEIITSDMVTIAYLPKTTVIDMAREASYLYDFGSVIGKQARTHIRPFEPILSTDIGEPTVCSDNIDLYDFACYGLPSEGYTLLRTGYSHAALEGFVYGDRVDGLYSFGDEDGFVQQRMFTDAIYLERFVDEYGNEIVLLALHGLGNFSGGQVLDKVLTLLPHVPNQDYETQFFGLSRGYLGRITDWASLPYVALHSTQIQYIAGGVQEGDRVRVESSDNDITFAATIAYLGAAINAPFQYQFVISDAYRMEHGRIVVLEFASLDRAEAITPQITSETRFELGLLGGSSCELPDCIVLTEGMVSIAFPTTDRVATQMTPGDKVDVIVSMLFVEADEDNVFSSNTFLLNSPLSFENSGITMLRVVEAATLVGVQEYDDEERFLIGLPEDEIVVAIAMPEQDAVILSYLFDIQAPMLIVPHVEGSVGMSVPQVMTSPPNCFAEPVLPSGIEIIEGNEEFIEIKNIGEVVDITAWSISDCDGNVYTFDEQLIFSNSVLTLYVGQGQDTPVSRYWGQVETVWQAGDMLILRDSEGNIRSIYRIP